MTWQAWVGVIGGAIGAVGGPAGVAGFLMARRDRADRRWARRREIPRLLAALEADYQVEFERLNQRERDLHQEIANEHNARNAYWGSAREDAQRRNASEHEEERAKLTRDYELERQALLDELKRLGGPPQESDRRLYPPS